MSRVKGVGSIEKRGENTWRIRPSLGYDPITNERHRPSRTIHGTKREAQLALAAWNAELSKGLKADAERITFAEYASSWQEFRNEQKCARPSTLRRDARTIKAISNYIGKVRVADIDATLLKNLYSTLSKEGKSQDYIFKIHGKIKQILSDAVNEDIILSNPCSKVKVAKPKTQQKRRALNKTEAALLLKTLDEAGDCDSHVIGVRIILATGLRRGEVLGLTWENVDLENRTIRVVQQYTSKDGLLPPKSAAGIRTVKLDASTIEHLAAWQNNQKQAIASLNPRRDNVIEMPNLVWSKDIPVVSSELFGFVLPENFYRWFTNFCVINGFGRYETKEGLEAEPTIYQVKGLPGRISKGSKRINGNGRDEKGKPYSRKKSKTETEEALRWIKTP